MNTRLYLALIAVPWAAVCATGFWVHGRTQSGMALLFGAFGLAAVVGLSVFSASDYMARSSVAGRSAKHQFGNFRYALLAVIWFTAFGQMGSLVRTLIEFNGQQRLVQLVAETKPTNELQLQLLEGRVDAEQAQSRNLTTILSVCVMVGLGAASLWLWRTRGEWQQARPVGVVEERVSSLQQ